MDKKAKLEIFSGARKGEEYLLDRATVHMGRAGDNDIIVDDHLVSRHHAQITIENKDYFIQDLDTANGTFVNTKRILNQKLQSGDIIQLGNEVYRFVSDEAQQMLTTSVPETQNRLKPLMYGIGLILVISVIWIWAQPTKSSRKISSEITSNVLDGPSFHELPSIEKESYLINKEKADRFYESGYRELIEKNYTRAIDDFKSALELFPDHTLAKLFLDKTHKIISEKADQHYTMAINYFNNAHYLLAIFHFKKVLELFEKRRPPEDYCTAREERRADLENPDYEKYCDAQRKISEAQTYE